MTTRELLQAVTQAGGRLLSNGDTLTLEAPAPLPVELLTALRQHKAALLALLREAATVTTQEVPTPGVAAFVQEHCTRHPHARTPGTDLLRALAHWRSHSSIPEGTATWSELCDHLRTLGCQEDPLTATWRGIRLTLNDPRHWPLAARDMPRVGHTGAPCARCGDTWRWPLMTGGMWCATCRRPPAPSSITDADGTSPTHLHRCAQCGMATWGPKRDEPGIWWCLTCHPWQGIDPSPST
jgi:hypothetical protein